MKKRFENHTIIYQLAYYRHLPEKSIEEVRDALNKRLYVCQQEFEETLDLGHEINILAEEEFSGKAYVRAIVEEEETIVVTLDCIEIEYRCEDENEDEE